MIKTYLYIIVYLIIHSSDSTTNHIDLVLLKNVTMSDQIPFEKEFNIFNSNSKIGNIDVFQIGDTLHISSSGTLTNNLFGRSLYPHDIELFVGEKMDIYREILKDEEGDTIIDKLLYKDSFIKLVYDSTAGIYQIVSSKILNKELKLYQDIFIGMEKKFFFNSLFYESISYDFSHVNLFINGDIQGELQQLYYFKDNILEKIIIKSFTDRIPMDL